MMELSSSDCAHVAGGDFWITVYDRNGGDASTSPGQGVRYVDTGYACAMPESGLQTVPLFTPLTLLAIGAGYGIAQGASAVANGINALGNGAAAVIDGFTRVAHPQERRP